MNAGLKGFQLGTVQLGSNYGVANRCGLPSPELAMKILLSARELGVEHLDTAQDYGDSELRIGAAQAELRSPFLVTTKLSARIDLSDAGAVERAMRASLNRLGSRPESVLLHSADLLPEWTPALDRVLCRMSNLGLCGRWGVSVYEPQELVQALTIESLEVIQAPFNVFDRRLLHDRVFARALASKKTIVVRSAFLQGLLVMRENEIPRSFDFALPSLTCWRELCRDSSVEAKLGALAYVREALPEAHIVVGCETHEQLVENLRLYQLSSEKIPGWRAQVESLHGSPRLIDPRVWN